MKVKKNSIYWFKRDLRLHDNKVLCDCIYKSTSFYPVYILEDNQIDPASVGYNRVEFLLETLIDLDMNLRKYNSKLYFYRGDPQKIFPKLFKQWEINLIGFQKQAEPHKNKVDQEISKMASQMHITVNSDFNQTLYDLDLLFEKNQYKVPATITSIRNIFSLIGEPQKPLETLDLEFWPLNDDKEYEFQPENIPAMKDFTQYERDNHDKICKGGETQALKNLEEKFKNQDFIANFKKPMTSPNALDPSTTLSSPYLSHGSLSVRKLYHKTVELLKKKKNHSEPPESLIGQLYFRELFYLNGYKNENFDQIINNPICKQIQWDFNPEYLRAWEFSQTGYPFIDAVMAQLRTQGWIHHLARHSVACFLTRGDLYQSWVQGAQIFEKYLLDFDWCLNNANWMWLSCSSFYYQYYRVYSPIAFGKKTDKNGIYIKRHLKQLKYVPVEYIYEPSIMNTFEQQKYKCKLGEDYPHPIVDHSIIHKKNMDRMAFNYGEDKKNVQKQKSVPKPIDKKKKQIKNYISSSDEFD